MWGDFRRIMDNKSSEHAGMSAPSHCRVNEMLRHHLKPKRPWQRKHRISSSPSFFPLNFPPPVTSFPLSHFLLPPVLDLLWTTAISWLLKSHLWWAGTEPRRSLKATEAIMSQHKPVVNYKRVPKQEAEFDSQAARSWRPFMHGINERLGSTSAHPNLLQIYLCVDMCHIF